MQRSSKWLRNLALTLGLLVTYLPGSPAFAAPAAGAHYLQPGLNVIGIPIDPLATPDLRSLLASLGISNKVSRVERLNPQSGAVEACDLEAATDPVCDALVAPGDAWLLTASEGATLVYGVELDCPRYELGPGTNLLSLPCVRPGLTSVELLDALRERGALGTVTTLDPDTGRWLNTLSSENGVVGANYPIETDVGYLLQVFSDLVLAPPAADTGPDRDAYVGGIVELGSTAAVPAAEVAQFSWSLVSVPAGSATVLQKPQRALAELVPDREGDFVARFTARDSIFANVSRPVTVHAIPAPLPGIVAFDPPSARIGTLITIAGNHLAPAPGLFPRVTIRSQNGGNVQAPVVGYGDQSIRFTLPTGAASGPLTVTVREHTLTTTTSLLVEPPTSFTLHAATESATVIHGEAISYALTLSSVDAFDGLAALRVSGLPPGISALFDPPAITSGQRALLSLTVPSGQPLGSHAFAVSASVERDGFNISSVVALNLDVTQVSTTFAGRTVVADDAQTPLAGVTISMLGRGSDGIDNGCVGETVSDASGNFALTDLPAVCAGPQLVRYNGNTTTDPIGIYASVDLAYELVEGEVTHSAVLVHLPRTDTAETAVIVQNSSEDQHFHFDSIPGLEVTVYAGTTITHPDGSQPDPYPLIALPIPVDRLPEAMPENETAILPFLAAFQPANSIASQPVAVTFPNVNKVPPLRVVELTTLDPTVGVMVVYGTGTVAANGTQIVPDPDPAFPGHRFGLVHFDWHGPRVPPISVQVGQAPVVNPGPTSTTPSTRPGTSNHGPSTGGGGGGCPAKCGCSPSAGDPIDLASGLPAYTDTDLLVAGTRGSIGIDRTYRGGSEEPGPFGLGTSHNYGFRLSSNTPQSVALVNLVMPDGNRLPLSRLPSGEFVSFAVPALHGAALQAYSDGTSDLRWPDGRVFHFRASNTALGSLLEGASDRNGNRITLVRNPTRPAQILEVIDPVVRKLRLAYDDVDRVTNIVDPIGREVRYTYNVQGTLETVTDPEGGVIGYDYDEQNRLLRTTDPRGVVMAENTYDTVGRVISQVQADAGIIHFAYGLIG